MNCVSIEHLKRSGWLEEARIPEPHAPSRLALLAEEFSKNDRLLTVAAAG
jgi:hypothetical protein